MWAFGDLAMPPQETLLTSNLPIGWSPTRHCFLLRFAQFKQYILNPPWICNHNLPLLYVTTQLNPFHEQYPFAQTCREDKTIFSLEWKTLPLFIRHGAIICRRRSAINSKSALICTTGIWRFLQAFPSHNMEKETSTLILHNKYTQIIPIHVVIFHFYSLSSLNNHIIS